MQTFKAVRNLIAELNDVTIEDQRECDRDSKRVERAYALLDAAWSNDAVGLDAARLKSELSDAFHFAQKRAKAVR